MGSGFAGVLVCVGFLLLVVLVVGAVLIYGMWASSDRVLAYFPYLNAIEYYWDCYGHSPPSITELEVAYNAHQFKEPETLPVPGYPVVTFRPIVNLLPGKYLNIVEPQPESYAALRRILIYARNDKPEASFEWVWNWEVSARIAADDTLREANRIAACSTNPTSAIPHTQTHKGDITD